MRKILFIISAMNRGGAETFLMKILRTININEYQIDFCITAKSSYDDEILALGSRIFYITAKTKNYFKFKKELYSVVKENEYDAILRVGGDSICYLDLKIAKKAGAKILAFRATNSKTTGGFLKKILHLLFQPLLNKYAEIKIAPSKLAADFTFGKKQKVCILNNGINYDIYKYNPEIRMQLRAKHEIEDGVFVIGHIGRFMKQKNHMFLLKIFEQYITINPKSKLVLVGKGELEDEIKTFLINHNLQQHVILTGEVSNAHDYYSLFDVLVFPSLFEGMPNVIIEAQASGLPIILSDSITKDAKITNPVYFVSLDHIKLWVDQLKNVSMMKRDTNTLKQFITNGYDINSVCEKFIQILFNNN